MSVKYPVIQATRNSDQSVTANFQNIRQYFNALAAQPANQEPVTVESCNITPGKILTVQANWTLRNGNTQEAGNTVDPTSSVIVVIDGQKYRLAVLK